MNTSLLQHDDKNKTVSGNTTVTTAKSQTKRVLDTAVRIDETDSEMQSRQQRVEQMRHTVGHRLNSPMFHEPILPFNDDTDSSGDVDNSNITDSLRDYPTTSTAIILLHLVYIFQFLRYMKRHRRRRFLLNNNGTNRSQRRNLTNYRQIIRDQRYYRAWIAILSHPPAAPTGGSNNNSSLINTNPLWFFNESLPGAPASNYAIQLPMRYNDRVMTETTADTTRQDQLLALLQRLYRFISIKVEYFYACLTRGTLSGLPLLLYNSHILWACRELESYYCHNNLNTDDSDTNDDIKSYSFAYARTLILLATMSLMLELHMSHRVVKVTQTAEITGTSPPELANSTNVPFRQLRHTATKRRIGSLTALAAAVLFVYTLQFEKPIKVVPFLSTRHTGGTSYILVMVLLFVLSKSTHFLLGVMCGTLAGAMWQLIGFNFLSLAHWGNFAVMILLLVTLSSLRAEYGSMWMPLVGDICYETIDYNEDGENANIEWIQKSDEYIIVDIDQFEAEELDDDDSMDDDDDDDSIGSDSADYFPSAQDVEIYGRLPENDSRYDDDNNSIRDDDDDDSTSVDDVEVQAFLRFNTVRSRRTPRSPT